MGRYVNVRGVPQAQKSLRTLTTRLFPKRGGPVLQGLRRGAVVMRRGWRSEIDRQVDESQAAGSSYEPTGLMRKSVTIYRVRNPQRHGATEMVRVTINPSATYASGERVAAVAGMLEHGDSRMEAKALVRKTFDSKRAEAQAAIAQGISTAIARILSKF